ncbi:hypothetical protein COO60DRAFT_62021 [Scenedesmus sp. NREL 46B-D3]|nr:hypothetical protein COO60DRAFT_62021 [Scenedesmus sp. NREL 46B-D3]
MRAGLLADWIVACWRWCLSCTAECMHHLHLMHARGMVASTKLTQQPWCILSAQLQQAALGVRTRSGDSVLIICSCAPEPPSHSSAQSINLSAPALSCCLCSPSPALFYCVARVHLACCTSTTCLPAPHTICQSVSDQHPTAHSACRPYMPANPLVLKGCCRSVAASFHCQKPQMMTRKQMQKP